MLDFVQDASFQPTERQEEMMFSLCQQLHLNFSEVTKSLTSHAAYSSKLTELYNKRQEQRRAAPETVGVLQGK